MNMLFALIRKVIAVVLFLIGLFFFYVGFSTAKDPITMAIFIITGLIPVALGFFIWPKKKKAVADPVQPSVKEPEIIEETTKKTVVTSPIEQPAKEYRFYVAGISYREKDIIDNILIEDDIYNMSKSELEELGYEDEDVIYKYEIATESAQLIPEPNNEYDPNAIKVVVDSIHVGYVPRDETDAVSKVLEKDVISITCKFANGPSKVIHEDFEDYAYTEKTTMTIEKIDHNISGLVTIKYK